MLVCLRRLPPVHTRHPFKMFRLFSSDLRPAARITRPTFLSWIVSILVAPLTFATTVIPPDFSTLVSSATRIVQATVEGSESAWVTQQGFRVIKTWVTLKVSEDLTGDGGSGTLRLEFLGGRVGEDEMRVEGSPRFASGEEVILFVANNGVDACPLVCWGHGVYDIKSDATTSTKRVYRVNGAPLASTSDVELSLTSASSTHPAIAASNLSRTALSLDEFKAAIRNQLRQGRNAN